MTTRKAFGLRAPQGIEIALFHLLGRFAKPGFNTDSTHEEKYCCSGVFCRSFRRGSLRCRRPGAFSTGGGWTTTTGGLRRRAGRHALRGVPGGVAWSVSGRGYAPPADTPRGLSPTLS
jgi:hypothetical protein